MSTWLFDSLPERWRGVGGAAKLSPLVLLLATAVTWMASADPGDELPMAEEVLDRFVEVTGGEAAYSAIVCLKSRGTRNNVIDEITGRFVEYRSSSGHHYHRFESELHGIIEEGCDGELSWADGLLGGPRLKTGRERALSLRNAYPDGACRWRSWVREARCTQEESMNDRPCYRLEITTEGGRPETRYYDQESGLHVRTDMAIDGWRGAMPCMIHYSDYRAVGEVLMPHHIRIDEAMGDEIHLTIDGFEEIAGFPVERIDPPCEVRALIE